MTKLEILIAARAKIENPEHWCQERLAETKTGAIVEPSSPRACRWCAQGALFSLTSPSQGNSFWNLLNKHACILYPEHEYMSTVNDTLGHKAVLRVYDAAIKELETPNE